MTPPVSVVVINFGSPELIRNLLTSLSGHSDRRLVREVVIVDNGYPETGDSRHSIAPSEYSVPVEFVQNLERSYASGINRGAEVCTGEVIAVSNNDVEWLPGDGLRPLVEALENGERVGIAGPQLVFPDGSWQRSYGEVPSIRQGLRALLLVELIDNALKARRFRAGKLGQGIRRVEYVDGAFMAIRRECFELLRGFDERYTFYGEDPDFCWRARRAGWRSVFVPTARIMHVRGASSVDLAPENFTALALAARCSFVARHSGPSHAAWYARLQRLRAWELAALYRPIALIRRTPAWRRRAALAASAASAAAAFRWNGPATDDPL